MGGLLDIDDKKLLSFYDCVGTHLDYYTKITSIQVDDPIWYAIHIQVLILTHSLTFDFFSIYL